MGVKENILILLVVLLFGLARTDDDSKESKESIECPLGSVLSRNRLSCFQCGPGYFNDNPKRRCNSSISSNLACCKVCPNGHICPGYGTIKPKLCLAGTAANFNKDQCQECPIGYYTATNASQCSISSCCSKCSPGHTCPLTGTSKPIKCLAGTSASFGADECINSPVGFFMLTDGGQCQSSSNSASDCFTRCPDGHICSGSTSSRLRFKRAITTIVPVQCLAGSAANFSRTACLPCPVGYYTDFDGAQCSSTSISSCCLKCPYGHICPTTGTSNPQMCPADTAASFDQTVCINCILGFHSSEASQCTSSSNRIDSCCELN